MGKIKEWLEQAGRSLTYSARRKKDFEKFILAIKDFENLTKEELMIEYVEKKSQYEFQKIFLISMAAAFVFVVLCILNDMDSMSILFSKYFFEVEGKAEEVIGRLHFLEIAVIMIFIMAFIIFMCFSLRDIRKVYKDLLILEAMKLRSQNTKRIERGEL